MCRCIYLQDERIDLGNFFGNLDLIEVHFCVDFTEHYQNLKMEEVVKYMLASLAIFPRSTPMPITYILNFLKSNISI